MNKWMKMFRGMLNFLLYACLNWDHSQLKNSIGAGLLNYLFQTQNTGGEESRLTRTYFSKSFVSLIHFSSDFSQTIIIDGASWIYTWKISVHVDMFNKHPINVFQVQLDRRN